MGCGPSHGAIKKRSAAQVIFEKYDKDKSGRINAKEFAEMCFAMGYRLSPGELDLDMQILGDSHGQITFESFRRWWKCEKRFAKLQWSPPQMEKVSEVRDIFDKYDKDKNGKIDKTEFKDMHSGLLEAGLTTKPLDQALMALDLDGDGKVDYSEYLKFVVGVGRGF